jgi:ubiquinone/menaquinone biosynthesis C-methylase UbiE
MGSGQEAERRGHVIGFREEIAKAAGEHDDRFFGWFDNTKDKDSSFVRGSWDFMFHIAQPIAPYLTDPEDRVALEIGHGGGRILAAASRCIKNVIGVDIHNNNAKVEEALRERDICNSQLFRTEGASLPVPSEAVDCVYSFIVLQHVERFSIFKRYLEETYRVLKPGGLAVLYFGRKYGWSFNRSFRFLYLMDRFAESLRLRQGFEELPAPVNSTNLRVSMSHARRVARTIGFTILRELVSRRRVPDAVDLYGGQNGLVLRKARAADTVM